jgi:hypothetical protein
MMLKHVVRRETIRERIERDLREIADLLHHPCAAGECRQAATRLVAVRTPTATRMRLLCLRHARQCHQLEQVLHDLPVAQATFD